MYCKQTITTFVNNIYKSTQSVNIIYTVHAWAPEGVATGKGVTWTPPTRQIYSYFDHWSPNILRPLPPGYEWCQKGKKKNIKKAEKIGTFILFLNSKQMCRFCYHQNRVCQKMFKKFLSVSYCTSAFLQSTATFTLLRMISSYIIRVDE